MDNNNLFRINYEYLSLPMKQALETNKIVLRELSNSISNFIQPSFTKISEEIIESLTNQLSLYCNDLHNQMNTTLSTMALTALENFNSLPKTELDLHDVELIDLTPSIDFLSESSKEVEIIDKEDIAIIQEYKNTKSLKDINYYNFIMLIASLLTVAFAIMGYYKVNPYEKETLDTLKSINYNIERLIDLETTK